MKYMQYETVKPKLAKSKGATKLTTDMSKLSSFNILRYLYRRHRAEVWITGFWLQVAVFVWVKLG